MALAMAKVHHPATLDRIPAVTHVCILNKSLYYNCRPALADGVAMAITERAYEQGGLLVAAPPGRHMILDLRLLFPEADVSSATAQVPVSALRTTVHFHS